MTPERPTIGDSRRSDGTFRQLLKGASLAFGLKVVGASFSFLLNLLLARLLGAEGAGVYFLALTVTTISSVVSRLGLDKALMRRVAVSSSTGDWAAAQGVYVTAMRVCVTAAFGITILVEASAPLMAIRVFGEPPLLTPLRVMALSIVPHALMVLHTEALLGVGAVRYGLLLQGFGVPLVAIPAVYLLARPFDVVGACGAYALATASVLVVGRVFWRRATTASHGTPDAPRTRELLDESVPLLGAAAMYLVLQWTDTIMLGIWTDAEAVGLYVVAVKAALLVSFVLQAIDSVAAPRYSALFGASEMAELEGTVRRFCALGAFVSLPLAALLILAPDAILGVFGPDFRQAAPALRILAVVQWINVATGSVSFVLIASKQETVFRNITLVAGTSNICLNAALIPLFGITGAAVATGASLVLMNALFVYWVRKSLSIMPLPLYPRVTE